MKVRSADCVTAAAKVGQLPPTSGEPLLSEVSPLIGVPIVSGARLAHSSIETTSTVMAPLRPWPSSSPRSLIRRTQHGMPSSTGIERLPRPLPDCVRPHPFNAPGGHMQPS